MRNVSLLFLCVLLTSLSDRAFGDEGMWLYTAPPTKQLKEKYNFEPSKQWLDHLQKSSVRFSSGGSGSFVSADGLVITNHHVGADAPPKILGRTAQLSARRFLRADAGRRKEMCRSRA